MSTPAQPVQPPAKITSLELISLTWVLFGFASAFFIARIFIRVHISRRLFTDDYLALLALAILLGHAILLTVMTPTLYMLLDVMHGRAMPGPNFMRDGTFYMKCQFAETIVFWSCLWAVKASFLSFFKRLVSGLKTMTWAWWTVVVITSLGYLGCVITYPVSCTSFTIGDCTSPDNVKRSLLSLRFSTAMDIITDALIISLPLTLAIRVRLPLRTKIALAAVFSLGAFVALFAIVRIVVTDTRGGDPEVSWLNLWSAIECSIAVVVCCLAPFKLLFSRGGRGTGYSGGTPCGRGGGGPGGVAGKGSGNGTYGSRSGGSSSLGTTLSGKRSHAQVTAIPLTERARDDVVAKDGTIVVTRQMDVEMGHSERGLRTAMWEERDSQEIFNSGMARGRVEMLR